jgi:hypothetical protein
VYVNDKKFKKIEQNLNEKMLGVEVRKSFLSRWYLLGPLEKKKTQNYQGPQIIHDIK